MCFYATLAFAAQVQVVRVAGCVRFDRRVCGWCHAGEHRSRAVTSGINHNFSKGWDCTCLTMRG
jgi:hypothetical protein